MAVLVADMRFLSTMQACWFLASGTVSYLFMHRILTVDSNWVIMALVKCSPLNFFDASQIMYLFDIFKFNIVPVFTGKLLLDLVDIHFLRHQYSQCFPQSFLLISIHERHRFCRFLIHKFEIFAHFWWKKNFHIVTIFKVWTFKLVLLDRCWSNFDFEHFARLRYSFSFRTDVSVEHLYFLMEQYLLVDKLVCLMI